MAIKISSINIRRLYNEDELMLANENRKLQELIKDTKILEKIRQIRNNGVEHKEELHTLTVDELREYYMSPYYNDETKFYRDKRKIEAVQSFVNKNIEMVNKDELDSFSRGNSKLITCRKRVKYNHNTLKCLLYFNSKKRVLENLYESDYVALSESTLTQSLDIPSETVSDKIIIITTDQEYMMYDLITNGFTYNGKDYELYSASAGQLRKKKIMFVESKSLAKAMQKLTNGLTTDEINKRGGVNINKWSAYLALSTSSTEIWKDIDLDRVCVVDDFETTLKDREVDHIDENYEITRMIKDVTISHTDGFGMMHPNFCKDTRMIRAPWIKGMVAPMDYRTFSRVFNGKGFIEDLWGEFHDIEEIDLILTKSQFKMWKYYDSWEDYKAKFKQNGCEFRFMIPESKKDLRLNALLNYQMWNTLEIDDKKAFADKLLEKDKDLIRRAHSDVGAMLELFHVDKEYERNTDMKKALYLYPQMLATEGFRTMLRDKIDSKKKEMKQGRVKVNGVYTFIIPDTFAWCERLILDIKNPKGLLQDGEVSCRLVNKDKDIAVNRSPHLYKEWCVRKNVRDKEHLRWFPSRGVYTSTHDTISKQLFFDVDGDIALVIDNDEIIEIAKTTMQDIVPLDFRLEKAPSQTINKENIFESYNLAFTANIGYYSNLITKVMNSDDKDIALVAKITWINNQIIDFAKTKWQLPPTEELRKQLVELDKRKLPYFFIWAKGKDINSVASPNMNSVVDMMAVSVEEMESYIKYSFRNIQKFDINVLLSNENVEEDEDLIAHFRKLSSTKHQSVIRSRVKGDRNFRTNFVSNEIRNSMYDYCLFNNIDLEEAVDMCIKHVFVGNTDRDALFTIFGDIIVDRLENKFPSLLNKSSTRCEICGEMVEKKNNRVLMCEQCYQKIDRSRAKDRMKKYRGK